MELLLWRWSTAMQVISALIIAIFFIILNGSIRRVELRPWVWAWLANLAAMVATVAFWYIQPSGFWIWLIRFGYFFAKTFFVALLVLGAYGFTHSTLKPRRVVLVVS